MRKNARTRVTSAATPDRLKAKNTVWTAAGNAGVNLDSQGSSTALEIATIKKANNHGIAARTPKKMSAPRGATNAHMTTALPLT